MHQWVCLLVLVVAASLLHGAGAEAGAGAAQLYAAVSGKQQRVQLGAGARAELHNGLLEVTAPLVVQGTAGSPATISCSGHGPSAFVVRGTTLELQHVIISGCSKQAILLKGPGAVLKAKSITFKANGPADTAAAPTALTQPLGLLIAASEAVVELTDVQVTANNGMRFTRSAAVPLWRPFLHPACQDDSVTGGVGSWGATDSSSSDAEPDGSSHSQHARQQACGSPLLASSLIDLEQSTLVLRGCRLHDNTADALITARGTSSHSVSLLQGTQLEGNRARWLVVADSWTHDPFGRKNMKAPQPSEAVKGLDMEPPYTAYSLMGQVRAPGFGQKEEEAASDEGGRRLLQQQQRQQPREGAQPGGQPGSQQQRQQRGPDLQQQQQQGTDAQAREPGAQPRQRGPDPQEQKPAKQAPAGGQQQQQQQAPPDLQSQQSGGQQEPDQLPVSPDSVVGKAPKGQVPLQVRLQGVNITGNVVQSGLLWLRLVNTSMQDTVVTHNIGTGGRSSIARQMQAVLAALPAKAAAAVAEAGHKEQHSEDPAELASKVASAGSIVPPGPCDVGALQRSLLIVHGPSAFDMLRCHISHNIHFSGAVMRVTEGLGPTSLRSSTFVNNTATAVLRFEGRTWVLKTDTFFAGIQFLDVLFYTQFQGASQAAYKFAELQHAQQQASKDKVSYDAFWFMSNTSMLNNTVFHSVVMSKGSRTSWRSFLAKKADILQSGRPNAAAVARNLPLINLSTSWWMRGCTLEGNRLRLPPGSSTTSTTSNTGPFSSKGGGSARSTGADSRRLAAPPPASGAGNGSSTAGLMAVAAGAAQKYENEWLEAMPETAYSDVLSAVLDADDALLAQLSQGGALCHAALRAAVNEQQEQLTLQVMLRATAPAVLWASTTQGYIEGSSIAGNSGFFHTLRMDNAYMTWRDVLLANNSAAFSVFDLWFGDAWVDGADVIGNQVQSGSIWNFESFRGQFQNIMLAGNSAGTARPSDFTGLLADDAACKKRPAKRPVLRGGRGGSVASPSSMSSVLSDGAAAAGNGPSLSPIWRMSHFLGELHKATIKNNTGSIALDISGMALSAPLTELLVAENMASGIRLLLPEPKYDNQSIELSDVWVVRNSLSPAAPLVGGLLMGGFTSGVGAKMPVFITNCVFVNNTPAQPIDTLTLQGGGVCIQGPASDSSDDPMSQHGFLQKLSINMFRTTVEGNMAAEGGGLWTAWPMIIEACSFRNNHAVVSGGAIYSKGLQQDSLGSSGALIINHTAIVNNTASFGGGIACDSCRAILAAQIDGNQAIRNVSLDNTTSSGWGGSGGNWGGGAGWSGGGSGSGTGSGCGNSSSSAAGGGNPLRRLRHAVLGAGGGIAANLAGNSYVIICVGGNGTTIDDIGPSTLRNNSAQALGGAVYLNSTMLTPDCPVFPQPGPSVTQTCFPGGYWPSKCGFHTLDLDWKGSMASAGGDLVAWAGDGSAFNMACTLSGAVCDSGTNSTTPLREAANASSLSSSSSSSSRTDGRGRSSLRQRDGRTEAGRRSGSKQGSCVRTFDAQGPYVCAAGSGLGGRNVMLVDETRKFQLPASFYVYNTTCIQESSNLTRSWQSCAVAGDIPHAIPRVFSGDTMNLTVSLGTSQQRLHPSIRNQDAVIGIVQLQQPPDGSLFVIGDIRQTMQMGMAMFNNMALQPVSPPISNREYEFRFVPAWGAGNDLLRQVKYVSVTVLLLRCTLGMHMTINRCVRCSANGTYSLNPFTNETIGCQPCPNGGLCQNGLLAPRSGYFSYNPFVPQILPCPLKGACSGGRRAGRGLTPAALQELQQQTLGVSGSSLPGGGPPAPRGAYSNAWEWGSPGNGRRLLVGEVAAPAPGAEGADSQAGKGGSLVLRPQRLPDMHELRDGSDAGEGGSEQQQQHHHHQQQQQQVAVISRRLALMGFNKLLAQLWANDTTDGMPLLLGVEYPDLLDAWHRLQCNPGYTGMFCGRCDLNYVPGELMADSDVPDLTNHTHAQGERYGLHMGSCVRCQSPAVISFALFGLFLLLFAYNAFGMCMQLRNSGVRDPYLRFVRSLAAQHAQQHNASSSANSCSGQLQPQGSGWTGTGLPPSGSSTNLARDSSSSQASHSQSQQPQMPSHHGSSNHLGGAAGSTHGQQQQQQQQQQSSPIGQCYSVHTVCSTQPVSYGFAVPFAAVGGGGLPAQVPTQPSILRPGMSQQQQQSLVRSQTMPSPHSAQRQGSVGFLAAPGQHVMQQQGSLGVGPLSPSASMASPFLQQAHLPPLPPVYSQQQYMPSSPSASQQQQQQQMVVAAPWSPMHAQHSQQRVSWADGNTGVSTSSTTTLPAHAGQGPRQSTGGGAGQAQPAGVAAPAAPDGSAGGASSAATTAAAAAAATGDGAADRSSSVSPQGGPVAAGSSFVFASQQDQQQARDQQRQPSPQDGWWGSGSRAAGPRRQQSLPAPLPLQQQQQQQQRSFTPPMQSSLLQQQQSQQRSVTPPMQSSPQQQQQQQRVLNYSMQASLPLGSMRHRYQSSVLTSASSQSPSVGRGSGRGASAAGNNASSHNSRRASNSSGNSGSAGQQQQQQQQQAGFKKGPAGLLVGLWKVLTSYLQVLGTVRHISLRALPEMSAQALAWADLSSFTSFVALDCLLPGPQVYHAFIKLFARTIALPILLLLASALMWTACWGFRHLGLRLNKKYGHRHTLRWQPLRQMQRHARVAPDPLRAYLSPRMLITLVVLSYSLYPLVTSGLLYTLQCVYIPGPFAAESASVEYSRRHHDWLLQRQAAANSSSSSGDAAGVAPSDVQLCRPGQGVLESGLCWVTGRYWAMDYDVQCFVGHHRAVAYFGLVMLLLVGVLFPVAAAVLLWINRKHLDDWEFAWKWSFLYAEYKPHTCFWEFIIMGRKLAFLAATILLPMALDTPEETTAQMQLLVCVLLAVTFLLLHASLHPFKRGVLNRLERLGLTAIALSCTLLAASLVVEKGRPALLALLGVVNVAVVAVFLFHIIKQLWLWVGMPASKAVGAAYQSTRGWWARHVSAKLAPKLGKLWPPACLAGARMRCAAGASPREWLKGAREWWAGRGRWIGGKGSGQQQLDQQQQQANGHAPPAQQQPQQQVNGDAASARQQRKQKAQQDAAGSQQQQRQAADVDAEQPQANGVHPPALQQQGQDQSGADR